MGSCLARPDLLMERVLIDGAWDESSTGRWMNVTNPATGALVGQVPDCGAIETRQTIAAARRALVAWRSRPARERTSILEAWHAAILANCDDLSRLITAEQGKPLAEAQAEVRYAASFVKWFAGEAVRISERIEASGDPDRRVLIRKEPVGVCAAITPWNFPAAMVTRKLAPALAAGCTMVLKPSELTPFTALALTRLAQEAGVPDGVIGVVTGAAEPIGEEMTSNPAVRKLSFTGSTRVGRILMQQCASDIKRLSLELGGNAPFLIFDDADLEAALAGVMASKFRNAGQTCVCANRILVQGGIHDVFVERLATLVEALKVGDGADASTMIGPLISPAAAAKFQDHVSDALMLGATISVEAGPPAQDSFVRPILLTGATPAMRLASEETFGPLAAIFRFDTEEAAIAMANDTPFGLAAYFYTRDGNRAWRVAEALEYGMVGLNTGSVSIETAPFGGIKQSGLGREGGREGIEDYLETKAFHWGGLA